MKRLYTLIAVIAIGVVIYFIWQKTKATEIPAPEALPSTRLSDASVSYGKKRIELVQKKGTAYH